MSADLRTRIERATTGANLRVIRQGMGLSQAALGEALRPPTTQHTISRYESGERRIPPGLWTALDRLRETLATTEAP